MDCGRAILARICCGFKVHLGFRVDGTWDACSDRSAAAVGGGGILPARAQPDVCGIFRGLGEFVGGFWPGKPRIVDSGVGRCGDREHICAVL